MPELRVAVIIPSSLKPQQLEYLEQCIDTLKRQTLQPHFDIIVVSHTTPTQTIKKKFNNVKFIQAEASMGFGEMNNLAFEQVLKMNVEWIMLLNDDAFLDQNFFKRLSQNHGTRTQADFIVPLVFSARRPTEIDNFGVEYFRSGYAKNNRDLDIETHLASAGCVVIRKDFLKKMKGVYGFLFNPLYYYYLEDVDFSLRAAMLDGKIVKDKQLIAYHYGSSSSGGTKNTFSLYHTYRNVLWVIVCCWPLQVIIRNCLNILIVQLWMVLYGTWTNGLLTYPRIFWQTCMALPRLLEYRKKTISNYSPSIKLRDVFSPHSFRTYHNKIVPAV
jgi:GT2 family glycosyltransferase